MQENKKLKKKNTKVVDSHNQWENHPQRPPSLSLSTNETSVLPHTFHKNLFQKTLSPLHDEESTDKQRQHAKSDIGVDVGGSTLHDSLHLHFQSRALESSSAVASNTVDTAV